MSGSVLKPEYVVPAAVAASAVAIGLAKIIAMRRQLRRTRQIATEVAGLILGGKSAPIERGGELVGTFEGRNCRVALQPGGCSVSLDFNRAVLPEGLRIEETSLYGPQLHEAWVSGAAIQTGNVEFDLSFIILGSEPGQLPDAASVRQIEPSLGTSLMRWRDRLSDADIRARSIKLSGTWTLKRGPREPTTADVKELLSRCLGFAHEVGA